MKNRLSLSVHKFSAWVLLGFGLLIGMPASAQLLVPSLSFSNPTRIEGASGAVGATYRFSEVTSGVDAIISIVEMNNVSLAELDVTSTGSWDAFQPQVKISNQQSAGTSAYMEFLIEFVDAGTRTLRKLADWRTTAIDIDGDDYRLRESVRLYGANSFVLEQATALQSEILDQEATFEAATIANQEGISTTATEHMVFAIFQDRSSFRYRTEIIDEGGGGGSSRASERMFSLNFDPALLNNFSEISSLPVEWGNLRAEVASLGIQLDWTTLRETNNDYFSIERSVDGVSFQILGNVAGAGTTEASQDYGFLDTDPAYGMIYYRIKQVDLNGIFTYSQILSTQIPWDQTFGFQVYPNPAKDVLEINSVGKDLRQVRLLNAEGRVVLNRNEEGLGKKVRLNLSSLSPGVYFLLTQRSESVINTHKIIIQ